MSFYHRRASERPKYASVLHRTIPVYRFYLLKEDEAKTKCSEILNLLFGVLVDNKRGYSPHCSKNTTQLVQHPRALSAKTPNKVYVSPSTCQTQGLVERLEEVVRNDKNGRYRKKPGMALQ